jgi:hypothetical protein
MVTGDSPDVPPEDETERAIWYIRRLTKAVTGQDIGEAQTRELFAKARERMATAQASVHPQPTRGPK